MRKMIRNKLLLCSALTAVGLAVGGTANAQNLNVLWYGDSSYNTGIDALSTPGTGDPSTTTWTITNDNTYAAPGAAIATTPPSERPQMCARSIPSSCIAETITDA